MEYRYFTQTPEGYQLKKATVSMYIAVALSGIFVLVFIWYALKTGEASGYKFAAVFLALIAILLYSKFVVRVTISPATKTLTYKSLRGTKTYPFTEFLNFQTTKVRTNGIVSRRIVSMYFNDNGRNKNIPLGNVVGAKAADKLIAEAQTLLSFQ